MLGAVLTGFATGLTLIVAIGAQNAFVLRQGLRREHVPMVVAICAASDALLIAAGVAGIGTIVRQAPAAVDVVRWLGVAFLVGYAVLAARRAVRGGHLDPASTAPSSAKAVLAAALAFTWLNPHVYLDTVLLLGSIANSLGDGRWWFAAGAAIGSLAWFCSLGFGARLLAPVFRSETAWRVLDGLIAAVMLAIAAMLALGG